MLASNFLISLAKSGGKFKQDQADYSLVVVQPIVNDFIKFIWEHKDDTDLFDVYKSIEKK